MAEPESERLSQCRVWVTRPQEQAAELCALVRSHGGDAVEFPLTVIEPAPAPDAARATLEAIGRRDCCVFVSRNAVRSALALCPDLPARAAGCRVFAVGAGTAAELSRAGISAASGPGPDYGSRDVLTLPELQGGSVRGRTVLIVRGAGGDAALQRELRRRGAIVDEVDVYRRGRITPEPGRVEALWQRTPPDVIVLASAGIVRALIDLTPDACRERLMRTPLAVISARVAEAARGAGFTGAIEISRAATDAGLCNAVLAWRDTQ
jgi:uroporphyrinogen-III synthase